MILLYKIIVAYHSFGIYLNQFYPNQTPSHNIEGIQLHLLVTSTLDHGLIHLEAETSFDFLMEMVVAVEDMG